MNEVFEELGKYRIVPVVVINNKDMAAPLADALCKGGLKCAEITFRTAAAKESIRIMTNRYPEMLVGAGTVLTIEQVESAVEAGAKFIVSPGFDEEIVDYCLDKNIPVLPGCMTPTEIMKAVKRGLNIVKFFPAKQAGGIAMLKALSAPFPNLKFMPTGGIDEDNLKEYLSFPKVIACGGSFMVKSELIDKGDFDRIQKLTRQIVELIAEN